MLIAAALACLAAPAAADDFWSRMREMLGGKSAVSSALFSSAEAEAALREALKLGADKAVERLGVADGYWGDPKVRIPLPAALAKTQKALAPLGLSGPIDEVQLKLNRAAEQAAPAAKSLFLDAISSMTLEDAIGIVKGGERAGADFLRAKSEAKLAAAFRPHVDNAVKETGAAAALDAAAGKVGLASSAKDLKASLTDHAVKAGLDGLFYYVGEEEAAIRRDPVKQTTKLLKRVFGA